MSALDPRDVLIYVKSEDIIRWVLPPDAQDEAARALRGKGFYTFASNFGSWSGHSGATGTFFDAGRFGNKPVRGKELPEGEADAIRRAWAAALRKARNSTSLMSERNRRSGG